MEAPGIGAFVPPLDFEGRDSGRPPAPPEEVAAPCSVAALLGNDVGAPCNSPRFERKMVEAPGIAPGSSDRECEPSTCVASHRTLIPPRLRGDRDGTKLLSLLTQRPAAQRRASLLETPADPQAVSADGAPELVQERRERHRVKRAFPDDIGNAVSVSTWCFARCFTRPPDNLGMPLTAHRSESILIAPHVSDEWRVMSDESCVTLVTGHSLLLLRF